jgi:hypothetical protein
VKIIAYQGFQYGPLCLSYLLFIKVINKSYNFTPILDIITKLFSATSVHDVIYGKVFEEVRDQRLGS